MEQKQLDEEDSFFGDEFIEEDVVSDDEKDDNFDDGFLKNVKDKKKSAVSKKVKAVKSTAKKDSNLKPEEGGSKTKGEEKDDIQITSAKGSTKEPKEAVTLASEGTSTPVNPWEKEEDSESKPSSTWKIISGILLVLLIVSIYTNGFGLTSKATAKEITLSEAEQKALNYVNNNLLQPPFVAELKGSEETDYLYQIKLAVAGQEVDSYLTKDGAIFFPQGFRITGSDTSTVGHEEKKVEVSDDDDAVKGNKDAPVTIIEFSDFECPFCGKYVLETYPKIIEDYVKTGKVKYVFRDFPLDFHKKAQKAAEAAECAGEQNKFWEMHDYLFQNQDYLAVENLKGYAKDLKLDTKKFNDCLDKGLMAEEVKKDLADGQKYGVSGTPGFFINGKLISGAQPYSVFKAEIEAALVAGKEAEENDNEGTEVEDKTVEEGAGEDAKDKEEDQIIAAETTTNESETNTTVATEEVIKDADAVEKDMADTTKEGLADNSAGVEEVKVVFLKAKKWMFEPAKITVNKGDTVQLNLLPVSDLKFTFTIPMLGIKKEVSSQTKIEFVADKIGSFEYKCGSCEDWRGMSGTLIVK